MDDHVRGPGTPRAAEWAVALGVTALVCSLLPVVGDWISAPLGVGAVVLGSVGVHVADRDGRPGTGTGLTGAILGLAALAVVLFSLVAGLGHAGPG